MANWKYKVDIKSIWNNEDTTVAEKGKLIAAVIRRTFPNSWFVDNSENYDDQLFAIYDDFLDVDGVEHFDDIMNRLYDYGDLSVPPFGVWPPHKMAWISTS